MAVIVTAAEVYSNSEPKRAVAFVARIGGGQYRVRTASEMAGERPICAECNQLVPTLGERFPNPYTSYEDAVAAAREHADVFDSSPEGAQAAKEHLSMLRDDELAKQKLINDEQAARISELITRAEQAEAAALAAAVKE